MTDEIGSWYWHIHDRELLERLTQPLQSRIHYIQRYKPRDEIKTRLERLKPVRGPLPRDVIAATIVVDAADAAYQAAQLVNHAVPGAIRECIRTSEALGAAEDNLTVALRNSWDEIEQLHARECPNCPWDGHTIFPYKD